MANPKITTISGYPKFLMTKETLRHDRILANRLSRQYLTESHSSLLSSIKPKKEDQCILSKVKNYNSGHNVKDDEQCQVENKQREIESNKNNKKIDSNEIMQKDGLRYYQYN